MNEGEKTFLFFSLQEFCPRSNGLQQPKVPPKTPVVVSAACLNADEEEEEEEELTKDPRARLEGLIKGVTYKDYPREEKGGPRSFFTVVNVATEPPKVLAAILVVGFGFGSTTGSCEKNCLKVQVHMHTVSFS